MCWLNVSVPIIVAACSAVVYGIGDWCGGRASRRQPAFVVTGVGQVVSLVGVLVAVLVMGRTVPTAHDWWWAGAGGIVGAVGLIAAFPAFLKYDSRHPVP